MTSRDEGTTVRAAVPRLVLVGGGARSGKSRFALGRAAALGRRRLFLATAEPLDEEMKERIRRHREDRGEADARGPREAEPASSGDGLSVTWEEPLDIPERIASLAGAPSRNDGPDVVLLDCVTLWLSNLLVRGLDAEVVERRVQQLCEALTLPRLPPVVVVTNEVGFGLVPETPLGRTFRDLAGFAHQRLAAQADEIHVAILGRVLELHPGPLVARAPWHYETSPSSAGSRA